MWEVVCICVGESVYMCGRKCVCVHGRWGFGKGPLGLYLQCIRECLYGDLVVSSRPVGNELGHL